MLFVGVVLADAVIDTWRDPSEAARWITSLERGDFVQKYLFPVAALLKSEGSLAIV